MLRVNNSSIQTKRSAKNVSCVFEKKGISLKKKCGHTRVAGVYIRSFKTIRITYVHVKGAGILVINTGNTYHSSFYANARSKTLAKNVKK